MYRLKHKPTGLYWQPHRHRGSHLSKKGKIYHTEKTALGILPKEGKTMTIQVDKNSMIYNETKTTFMYEDCKYALNQVRALTQIKDWVVEKLENPLGKSYQSESWRDVADESMKNTDLY